MNDQLRQFFLEAKKIGLADDEKTEMRGGLVNFLRHESVRTNKAERQKETMDGKKVTQAGRETHRLQSDEKAAMREQLRAHMQKVPVRESEPFFERSAETLLSFFHGWVPRLALSAFVLFVTGGSVAYAAQDTLPGDTLYPLKVGVYEPVVSWFALTADAQASWDVDRALRRLEEAEQLAARSALTHDTLTDIERRFAEHVNLAHEGIVHLADNDAQKALTLSAELESHLQAHGSIIQMLDDDGEEGNGVSRLLQGVAKAGEGIAVVRLQTEQKSLAVDDERSLRASAARRMNHSLQQVRKLQRDIASAGAGNPHSLEKLSEAESLLEQASERLQQGSAADALELSRSAIRITKEGKLFFSVGDDDHDAQEASSSSLSSSAETSSAVSRSSSSASSPGVEAKPIVVPDDNDEEGNDDEDADDQEEHDADDEGGAARDAYEDIRNEVIDALDADADIDIDLPF